MYTIKKITEKESEKIRELAAVHWQSSKMAVHGEVYDISVLPGFYAEEDHSLLGLITYREASPHEFEIMSLDSFEENRGIGSSLLRTVIEMAEKRGAGRLFLTTTNENLRALGFYQRRGFTLCELRLNAVREARKLKPDIPLADDGIPINKAFTLSESRKKWLNIRGSSCGSVTQIYRPDRVVCEHTE
ncbi:GNAT family N-acetyltransferase [Sporolactobacillus sp. THM7-4]|nr:GNAT family N-acetyltransferase [Sporolactobacillus sp. THM7-4]